MKIARNKFRFIVDILAKKLDVSPIGSVDTMHDYIVFRYAIDKFRLEFKYDITRDKSSKLNWLTNFVQSEKCALVIRKECDIIIFESEDCNFLNSILGVVKVYEYI